MISVIGPFRLIQCCNGNGNAAKGYDNVKEETSCIDYLLDNTGNFAEQ